MNRVFLIRFGQRRGPDNRRGLPRCHLPANNAPDEAEQECRYRPERVVAEDRSPNLRITLAASAQEHAQDSLNTVMKAVTAKKGI